MLSVVFVTFECFALLINVLKDQDDFYDQRDSILARLNAKDLARFARISGDPVLGWDRRGPSVNRGEACSSAEVTYTSDAQGARTYSGYDRDHAKILVVGDSFTEGAEAGDDETYPAVLANMLGVSVANHGVGGYGPVQAFLSFKGKIGLYPDARVVILGIMYENVYRMVNSYRAVLNENAFSYGLKPYISNGKIVPHPGQAVLEDIDLFRDAAESAFDHDFWAKPKLEFPYFVSLLRGIGSHYFYYLRLQKRLRKWDIPEYYITFRSDLFVSELVSLLNQYASFARAANLTPVAVFIPRNGYDTQSASAFIEANRSRLAPGLVVGDVGSADIDWSAFNQINSETGDPCHPSSYGYRRIAEYVADLLRVGGVWPAQASAGLTANAGLSQHQP
jgi:lysophospholipase L1-like esterase